MSERYRISELAQKAGVTNRTVHYYVGRGLLPPPDGAGIGTSYREEHLLKLRLIKKLQEQYLPLERIREIISGLSLGEVRRALEEETGQNPVMLEETAGDYTRSNEDEVLDCKSDCLLEHLVASPAASHRSAAKSSDGRSYVRHELGLGIELHIPEDISKNRPDLVESIRKYTRRLLAEK